MANISVDVQKVCFYCYELFIAIVAFSIFLFPFFISFRQGLKLSEDKQNCDDIDECAHIDENICGHMECHNSYGSFRCEERKNLCENNGGCSQLSWS